MQPACQTFWLDGSGAFGLPYWLSRLLPALARVRLDRDGTRASQGRAVEQAAGEKRLGVACPQAGQVGMDSHDQIEASTAVDVLPLNLWHACLLMTHEGILVAGTSKSERADVHVAGIEAG